jgi:hypothetical protein
MNWGLFFCLLALTRIVLSGMRLSYVFFSILILFLDGWVALAASTNPPDPARLKYNLRTTVEAYEKAGHKDPKWDAAATNCLAIFANILSLTNNSDTDSLSNLQKNLSALDEAKCDDPLIHYLYVRYVFAESHPATDNGPAFWQAASALQKSDYPPIRKYYAVIRARNVLREGQARSPELETLWDKGISFLILALDDKSMPEKEADIACDLLISPIWWSYGTRWELYHKLEPVLTQSWDQTSFAQLMKGQAYLSYAWAARGSGWANTVSAANWKLMAERLDVSAKALDQAWQLNPHDSRICHEMMHVELGQGKGRERLESWFQRGMKVNPADYDLCFDKLEYLRPKWYGSHEQMIAFGRECAMNTNWSGLVPMMLADSHDEVFKELTLDEQTGYWKRPEVWADIQLSFDRLFKASPNLTEYRQNYSFYAYWAGHWQVFLDQTKLFPWTNYAYFGGEQQYNAMLKTAGEQLKQK